MSGEGIYSTNGCTGWFDGTWKHCCDVHDIAYASGADKLVSDFELAKCVAETGNGWMAFIMLIAVVLFGWVFKKRQAPKLPVDEE